MTTTDRTGADTATTTVAAFHAHGDAMTFAVNPPSSSLITVMADDARLLLSINADGTVDGSVEDASEAAGIFVREIRRLIQQPPAPGTDSSGQATCGRLSPAINFGGDQDAERFMCELPHGHGGAHQRDNGDGLPPMRWIALGDSSEQAAQRVLDAGDAYLDQLARSDNPTLQRAVAEVRAERAAVAGPQRDHGGEGGQ